MFRISLIIIGIIFFLNIVPLDKLFADGSYYRYSNSNGSMTFVEYKSRDFEMMNRRFESYRKEKSNHDTTLYRLFKKNPLAFWRWGQYFFSKRYRLPYKAWAEIKSVRGADPENKSGFQDF
jgi:hypothetical protein